MEPSTEFSGDKSEVPEGGSNDVQQGRRSSRIATRKPEEILHIVQKPQTKKKKIKVSNDALNDNNDKNSPGTSNDMETHDDHPDETVDNSTAIEIDDTPNADETANDPPGTSEAVDMSTCDLEPESVKTKQLRYGSYFCYECKSFFTNFYDLIDHLLITHRPDHAKYSYCDKCGTAFTCTKELHRHKRNSPGEFPEMPFECETCCMGFTGKSLLDFHMKGHEKENLIQCGFCMKEFGNKCSEYLKHLNSHLILKENKEILWKDNSDARLKQDLPVAVFRCHKCSTVCTSPADFACHLYSHKLPEIIICYQCGTSTSHRKTHNMIKYHNNMPHVCLICDKTFKTSDLLDLHKSTHFGKSMLQCDLCYKTFKVHHHYYYHKNDPIMKAKNCKKEEKPSKFTFFAEVSIGCSNGKENQHNDDNDLYLNCSLLKHCETGNITYDLTKRNRNDVFKCDVCEFPTKSFWHLCYHMNEHGFRKFEICHTCGLGVASKTLFERHKIWHNMHKETFLYQCSICSLEFMYIDLLDLHVKIQHKGIPLLYCEFCDKPFSKRYQYANHMKAHSKLSCNLPKLDVPELKRNKSFPCCFCQKSFKPHMVLMEHMNTEHFLVCHVCNKKLPTRMEFEAHKQEHLNEFPYKCVHCNRIFPTFEAIVHHMNIHINIPDLGLYVCKLCTQPFEDRKEMETHALWHKYDYCKICRLKIGDDIKMADHIEQCKKSISEMVEDDATGEASSSSQWKMSGSWKTPINRLKQVSNVKVQGFFEELDAEEKAKNLKRRELYKAGRKLAEDNNGAPPGFKLITQKDLEKGSNETQNMDCQESTSRDTPNKNSQNPADDKKGQNLHSLIGKLVGRLSGNQNDNVESSNDKKSSKRPGDLSGQKERIKLFERNAVKRQSEPVETVAKKRKTDTSIEISHEGQHTSNSEPVIGKVSNERPHTSICEPVIAIGKDLKKQATSEVRPNTSVFPSSGHTVMQSLPTGQSTSDVNEDQSQILVAGDVSLTNQTVEGSQPKKRKKQLTEEEIEAKKEKRKEYLKEYCKAKNVAKPKEENKTIIKESEKIKHQQYILNVIKAHGGLRGKKKAKASPKRSLQKKQEEDWEAAITNVEEDNPTVSDVCEPMQTENEEESLDVFYCGYCQDRFTKHQHLMLHLYSMHTKSFPFRKAKARKIFICFCCGVGYLKLDCKKFEEEHLATHIPGGSNFYKEKPHCKVVGCNLRQKNALLRKYHMNFTHQKDNVDHCDHCSKNLQSESEFIEHYKRCLYRKYRHIKETEQKSPTVKKPNNGKVLTSTISKVFKNPTDIVQRTSSRIVGLHKGKYMDFKVFGLHVKDKEKGKITEDKSGETSKQGEGIASTQQEIGNDSKDVSNEQKTKDTAITQENEMTASKNAIIDKDMLNQPDTESEVKEPNKQVDNEEKQKEDNLDNPTMSDQPPPKDSDQMKTKLMEHGLPDLRQLFTETDFYSLNMTEFMNNQEENDESLIFKCGLCGIRFDSYSKLLVHLHDKIYKPFSVLRVKICLQCGIGSKPSIHLSSNWIKEHAKEHPNSTLKYACNTCNERFSRPEFLKLHEDTHKGMYLLRCECNRDFRTSAQFLNHIGLGRLCPTLHGQRKRPWKNEVSADSSTNTGTNSTSDTDTQTCAGQSLKVTQDLRSEGIQDTNPVPTVQSTVSRRKEEKAGKAIAQLQRLKMERVMQKERFKALQKKINNAQKIANAVEAKNLKGVNCKVCGIFHSFTSGRMCKHGRDLTYNNASICKLCGKVFKTRNSLNIHTQRLHSYKQYECPECGIRFSLYEDIQKHTKLVHGKTYKKEVQNNKPASLKSTQDEHDYSCNSKVNEVKVDSGMKYIHTSEVLPEDQSDIEQFYRKIDNRFHCKICGRLFKTRKLAIKHLRIKHDIGEKKYDCSKCPKKFYYKDTLRRHIKDMHTWEEKPCPFCGQVFKSRRGYENHLKLAHKDQYVFKKNIHCDYCPQKFPNNKERIQHLKLYHSNMKLPCHVCGKIFSSTLSRRRHKERKHDIPIGPADYPLYYDFSFMKKNYPEKYNRIFGISSPSHTNTARDFRRKSSGGKTGPRTQRSPRERHGYMSQSATGGKVKPRSPKKTGDTHGYMSPSAAEKMWSALTRAATESIAKELNVPLEMEDINERPDTSNLDRDTTVQNNVPNIQNSIAIDPTSDEFFVCDICGKMFLDALYLKYHRKKIHDSKQYNCNLCGYIATGFKQASTHKRRVHTGIRLMSFCFTEVTHVPSKREKEQEMLAKNLTFGLGSDDEKTSKEEENKNKFDTRESCNNSLYGGDSEEDENYGFDNDFEDELNEMYKHLSADVTNQPLFTAVPISNDALWEPNNDQRERESKNKSIEFKRHPIVTQSTSCVPPSLQFQDQNEQHPIVAQSPSCVTLSLQSQDQNEWQPIITQSPSGVTLSQRIRGQAEQQPIITHFLTGVTLSQQSQGQAEQQPFITQSPSGVTLSQQSRGQAEQQPIITQSQTGVRLSQQSQDQTRVSSIVSVITNKRYNLPTSTIASARSLPVTQTHEGAVKEASVTHTQGGAVKEASVTHTQGGAEKEALVTHTQGGAVKEALVTHTQGGAVKEASVTQTHEGAVKEASVTHTQGGALKEASVTQTHKGAVNEASVTHTQGGAVKEASVTHTQRQYSDKKEGSLPPIQTDIEPSTTHAADTSNQRSAQINNKPQSEGSINKNELEKLASLDSKIKRGITTVIVSNSPENEKTVDSLATVNNDSFASDGNDNSDDVTSIDNDISNPVTSADNQGSESKKNLQDAKDSKSENSKIMDSVRSRLTYALERHTSGLKEPSALDSSVKNNTSQQDPSVKETSTSNDSNKKEKGLELASTKETSSIITAIKKEKGICDDSETKKTTPNSMTNQTKTSTDDSTTKMETNKNKTQVVKLNFKLPIIKFKYESKNAANVPKTDALQANSTPEIQKKNQPPKDAKEQEKRKEIVAKLRKRISLPLHEDKKKETKVQKTNLAKNVDNKVESKDQKASPAIDKNKDEEAKDQKTGVLQTRTPNELNFQTQNVKIQAQRLVSSMKEIKEGHINVVNVHNQIENRDEDLAEVLKDNELLKHDENVDTPKHKNLAIQTDTIKTTQMSDYKDIKKSFEVISKQNQEDLKNFNEIVKVPTRLTEPFVTNLEMPSGEEDDRKVLVKLPSGVEKLDMEVIGMEDDGEDVFLYFTV